MKRILSVLVLLSSALAKENALPELHKSPMADYLLGLARIGRQINNVLETFQEFNPQRMAARLLGGEAAAAANRWDEYRFKDDIQDDDFLSEQFTPEEQQFIRKTIIKSSRREGSEQFGHVNSTVSIKKQESERLLQETVFDQIPNITPSLEDDYKNEQLHILNRLTLFRYRVTQNYSLTPNRTCAQGTKLVNHSISVYACRGVRLTPEEYTNRTNKTGCFINNASVEACFCSFDYYGRYCTKFAGITCQGDQYTDYDPDCVKDFQRQYGTKRMGYPPCRHFKNGVYDFQAGFSCSLYNVSKSLKTTDFMREGVKLEYLMIPENKVVHQNYSNTTFTMNYTLINEKVGWFDRSTDY